MIQERILKAFARYVTDRIPTGNFLNAVLTHNLDAVVLADEECLANIVDIVRYVHNEMPGNCHGSKEKVQAWLAERGATHEKIS